MKNILKTIGYILLALSISVGVSYAATIFTVGQGGTGVNTITGLIKGNGTSPFTVATAGTDYQAPVTLTTSGTSGAATFISNTLNIPQYAGTSPSIGGTLTSATAGSVLYAGSGVFAQDNSNLFYDSTNKRLGIGTATPGVTLAVNSTATSGLTLTGSSTANAATFTFADTNDVTNTAIWRLLGSTAANTNFKNVPTSFALQANSSGGLILATNSASPAPIIFSIGTAFSNEAGRFTSAGLFNLSSLTASKVVFTDSSKNLTSTGIGTSSQFIKGDGSLDSTVYQTPITLTTTGTSGLATFSGGTLNIPNYTYTLPTASTSVLGGVKVDGTSITISGGVISAATSGGGTVTSVTSATGDATVANTTTTPIITIVSAPKLTTARTIAGTSFDGTSNVTLANKFIVQGTTDAGLTGAQFLGALGTGIVKNTTTTGVLSIAVAGDFPTLNQNTTGSAATLTTPRAINGVNFDGSAAITVTAAAGTLTGTTLNSSVVTSSLTSVGTLGALTVTGNITNSALTASKVVFTDASKNLTSTGIGTSAQFIKGDGSLDSTSYQGALTLTTTGTSGASTLVGNTLNIPQYAGTTYTAGTGLTLTTGTFSVNTSQNIATLSNLTSNGFVTTSGGAGTLSVTGSTGSGNVVLATSPTLVTPVLGVATGTSFNGVALTTGGSATTFLSGAGSYAAPFTLTTTGTSGAATFSGGTLNIPQYTGGTGTVTSVATDSTLTGGPITTTGTLGINLANANTWTAKQTISTAPFVISGNQTLAAWGLVGPQISVAAATLTDSSTAAGATVTNAMANSIGIPTITAANATSGSKVTYTNAASLYIAGIPALGTNTLATNMYALDVATGLVFMGGQLNVSSTINSSSFMTATNGYFINGTNQGIESTNSSTNVSIRSGGVQNRLVIASTGFVGIGSITVPGVLTTSFGATAAAWGLNGINLQTTAQTFTDSSTASGTVTNNMVNTFGIPTLAATNAAITYTNAATVYIAGAPVNGTNATITNKYALDVAGGLSFFGGHMNIEGVTSTGATGTGNLVFATSPTLTGASINGVTLSTGAGSTTFLNGAGSYSTPSVSVTPQMNFSTFFDTSARLAFSGSGSTGLGTSGLTISQTEAALVVGATTSFNEFNGNPTATFNAQLNPNGANTGTTQWFCIGDTVIATTSTSTTKHECIKVVWGAGAGTASIFGDQADGTTQNTSSAMTTGVAVGSVIDAIVQVTASTVNYYVRVNGGTQFTTSLSSNIPTGNAGTAGIIFDSWVNNTGNGSMIMSSESYSR